MDAFRIVSLTPSNTEIVHALGLTDRLVGVDDYSDYPSNLLEQVPRLGPDLQIRIEDVQRVKPDLVLASLSVPGMERVVEQLKQTGLPYVVLNPKTIADIWEDIRTVGRLLDVEERAELLISSCKQRIENAQERIAPISATGNRVSLYWEWWPKPCITPGKWNWLTEISELAGATNLFADVEAESVIDVGEQVIQRNPDYILAVWCGVQASKVPKSKILSRPGWEHVNAIQQGRVYILEEGLFCRPSPRLIDGLEHLVDLLTL